MKFENYLALIGTIAGIIGHTTFLITKDPLWSGVGWGGNISQIVGIAIMYSNIRRTVR